MHLVELITRPAAMAFRSAVAALCVANALGAFRIKLNGDAGPLASLGGFELRRYLYAGGLISGEELTGALRDTAPLVDATPTITLTTSDAAACSTAEVVSAVRANADGYAITQTGTATCITGFDDAGVLQGAYTLLEHLGFFFSSTNPVIPAVARPFPADGFRLVATPAFTTRGLQPFHGECEGLASAGFHRAYQRQSINGEDEINEQVYRALRCRLPRRT